MEETKTKPLDFSDLLIEGRLIVSYVCGQRASIDLRSNGLLIQKLLGAVEAPSGDLFLRLIQGHEYPCPSGANARYKFCIRAGVKDKWAG